MFSWNKENSNMFEIEIVRLANTFGFFSEESINQFVDELVNELGQSIEAFMKSGDGTLLLFPNIEDNEDASWCFVVRAKAAAASALAKMLWQAQEQEQE